MRKFGLKEVLSGYDESIMPAERFLDRTIVTATSGFRERAAWLLPAAGRFADAALTAGMTYIRDSADDTVFTVLPDRPAAPAVTGTVLSADEALSLSGLSVGGAAAPGGDAAAAEPLLLANGTMTLTSGQSSSGIILKADDPATDYSHLILRGGTAAGTLVDSGGSAIVSSNGSAVSTEILAGGRMVVSNSGRVMDTTIRSGGSASILGYARAENVTVYSGGTLAMTTNGVLAGEIYLAGTLLVAGDYSNAGAATITYVLQGRTSSDPVLIQGIDWLSGVNRFNLTIDSAQTGVYKLADVHRTQYNYNTHYKDVYLYIDGMDGTDGVKLEVNGNGYLHSDGYYYFLKFDYSLGQYMVYLEVAYQVPPLNVATVVDRYDEHTPVNEKSLREVMSFTDPLYFDSAGQLSAGFTSDTLFTASGALVISSGRIDQVHSDILLAGNGSAQTVISGGQDNRLFIGNGDTFTYRSMTIQEGIHIEYGGTAFIGSNAFNSGGVIGGGEEYVGAGARTLGVTLLDGLQVVSAAGQASGTVISGGSQVIHSGAIVNSTVVAGGSQIVTVGARSFNTVISSGVQLVSSRGSAASSTLIGSGGTQILQGGATAENIMIRQGGTQLIESGARLLSGYLDAGGKTVIGSRVEFFGVDVYFNVTGHAPSEDFLIENLGGADEVKSFHVVIDAAGQQHGRYALASRSSVAYVQDSNFYFHIDARDNGSIFSLTVGGSPRRYAGSNYSLSRDASDNLYLTVDRLRFIVTINEDLTRADDETSLREAFNSFSSDYLDGDGRIEIGFLPRTDFASGGYVAITSGDIQPIYSNTLLTGNGTENTVISGGLTAGRIVVGQDDHLTVESLTILDGLDVVSGGSQTVGRGGRTDGATVSAGGIQFIGSAGNAVDTRIGEDGEQQVRSAGSAAETTVFSGGTQRVGSGGLSIDIVVSSGGVQILDAGSTVGGVLDAGGEIIIADGTVGDGLDLYFNISARTAADDYICRNLDGLSAVDGFYVSVKADPDEGTYKLAEGAGGFDTYVTLKVGDVLTDVTLSVGEAKIHDNVRYSLNRDAGGNLTFSISREEPPSTIVTIPADIVSKYDFEYSLRQAVQDYARYFADEQNPALVTFDLNPGETMPVILTDGDIRANVATVIDGGGSAAVTGGGLFGDGNALTLRDITWDNHIAGGASDADLASGTELTVSGMTRNDGYIVGGSIVDSGSREIDGSVSLTAEDLSMTSMTARIVAAGWVSGNSFLRINGDISFTATGVLNSAAAVYGARVENGATLQINGGIDISLSTTGSVNGLYAGGAVLNGGNLIVRDTVSLSVDGGTFTGPLGPGVQAAANGSSTYHNGTRVTIRSGTFDTVYAGGYNTGGGSLIFGDCNLTITGGVFNQDIYGGGFASNSVNGTNNLIYGDTDILIDCSGGPVTFNGTIHGGGYGYAVINGNTSITFSGSGDNLIFAAGSVVSGDSQAAVTKHKFITGDKYLTFADFSGDFTAPLASFTVVTFSGDSSVNFTGGASAATKLQEVEEWNFTLTEGNRDGGVLIWGSGVNNFSGDSLEVAFNAALFAADDTAVLLKSGSANVLNGWQSLDSVSFDIDGSVFSAAWNELENGWLAASGSDRWLLSATDDYNLVLSRLA